MLKEEGINGALRQVCAKALSSILGLRVVRLAGTLTRRQGYRGIGRLARILSVVWPVAPIQIRYMGGATLEIDVFDYYWARLVFDDFIYEPEIEAFLKGLPRQFCIFRLRSQYWILEPSSIGSFGRGQSCGSRGLSENICQAQKEYRIIWRSRCGVQLCCFGVGRWRAFFCRVESHAEAHLANENEVRERGADEIREVGTITIDELRKCIPDEYLGLPVVIKLDVEGAEIAALRGAEQTIKSCDVMIIYECHGSDRECINTAHFLRDGRFFVHNLEDGLKEVSSVEDAIAIKKDGRKRV